MRIRGLDFLLLSIFISFAAFIFSKGTASFRAPLHEQVLQRKIILLEGIYHPEKCPKPNTESIEDFYESNPCITAMKHGIFEAGYHSGRVELPIKYPFLVALLLFVLGIRKLSVDKRKV